MFNYIFNNYKLTFRYNRDLHGDINLDTRYIVLDTNPDDNNEYDINSIGNNINLVYYSKNQDGNVMRISRNVLLENFNNKNFSLVDHDEDIVIPSKTIFELLFNTDNETDNILHLRNIPGYEINNKYYNLMIDFNDMFSIDDSVVLRFAQKIIYNFDIIKLEYDDQNIVGHNTIYDLHDCYNRGEPSPSPTARLTRQDATTQINNLCNNRFDFIEGQMGGNTYYSMGQRDSFGDGQGSCCRLVKDAYDNTELITSLSDPEMSNVQSYAEGCMEREHIPRSIRPRCIGYVQHINNDCNNLQRFSDLQTGGLPGGEWENCCNSVKELHPNIQTCQTNDNDILNIAYVNNINRALEKCP